MKIAIISDVHDNRANLAKTLTFIKKEKIRTILCCGDLGSREILQFLQDNFSGRLERVSGNLDKDLDFVCLDQKEIRMDQKKIVLVHWPKKAKELAQSQKYDLIFYGHNHKPWQEKIGKTVLINPGNLAGIFYKPTFAIYDTETDRLELKILERI